MRRRITLTAILLLLSTAVVLWGQSAQESYDSGANPWWRVFGPGGQSYGVSYGTTRPTAPQPGEIFVDMDGDGDSGAVIEIWDNVNAEWNQYSDNDTTSVTIGTLNTVVKFGAADLADSQITDDATTIDFTVADLTFTNGGTITSDGNMFINAASGGTGVMLISADRTQNVAGAPAANTDIYEWVQTLPITAAGQTTNILNLELTNANHTGGTVNAINVAAITGDAQATENALNIAAGFDNAINATIATGDTWVVGSDGVVASTGYAPIYSTVDGNTISLRTDFGTDSLFGVSVSSIDTFAFTSTPNAAVDFMQLNATISILTGAEVTNVLNLVSTNANHTGGTLNGINVAAITGDAQATETAINIGSGWDYGLSILADGSATTNAITLGASQTADVQLYFDGSAFVIDANGTTGNDVTITLGASSSSDFNVGSDFQISGRNDVNTSVNYVVQSTATINNVNGSEIINLFFAENTDATWATGTGNELRAFRAAPISTPEVDATEIAFSAGAGWDLAMDVAGAVVQDAYRNSFDGPCNKVEAADHTAELVTDAAVNLAYCEGSPGMYTYRLDGAQSSPFIVVPGAYLDLDNDGITNEGVEVILADLAASTQGWTVVGTSPAMYVRANITITSVSGTDNFNFGWRLAEAFVDDIVMATYDTYGVYRINDAAGNLQIQTGDDTVDATDEEDQVVTWADAATHTLEVRVSTAGVFTFFIDGLPSTITTATGAAAAGDVMYPFIGMLNDTDADTELRVNWIEVGEVQ